MFLDIKSWNITLDGQLKWQKSGSEYNLPFSCRNQLLFIRNSIESRSEYVTSSTCTLLPCQYLLYVVTYNLPNELKNFIASLAGPWYTVWPFPNKHSVAHNLNIEYLGWWIEKMMVFPRSANLKVKVIVNSKKYVEPVCNTKTWFYTVCINNVSKETTVLNTSCWTLFK